MNLRYNHKSGDILSDDNMIVATVAGAYRRNDPSLGAKMAAGPELAKILDDRLVLSKYHGMNGFEYHRFFDDYEEWMKKIRAALARATTP